MRLEEHADEQFVHRLLPECDFLVPVFYASAQFQPVQRTLARQGFEILLTGQNAEHRVRAQLLVIVQVFIAQGKAVNPLRQHLADGMLHQRLIPAVEETC
jgi:hypothetical protein